MRFSYGKSNPSFTLWMLLTQTSHSVPHSFPLFSVDEPPFHYLGSPVLILLSGTAHLLTSQLLNGSALPCAALAAWRLVRLNSQRAPRKGCQLQPHSVSMTCARNWELISPRRQLPDAIKIEVNLETSCQSPGTHTAN